MNPTQSFSHRDPPLSMRSLFMHAWDLSDRGVDCVMDWMNNAGLNTMCLAVVYHSGWFLHPHHSKHRAFMAESGACYFHPHLGEYKTSSVRRITPIIARMAKRKASCKRRLKSAAGVMSVTGGSKVRQLH